MADEVAVSIDEVRAELSERGQLEFELAAARAINKKLAAQILELQGASDG